MHFEPVFDVLDDLKDKAVILELFLDCFRLCRLGCPVDHLTNAGRIFTTDFIELFEICGIIALFSRDGIGAILRVIEEAAEDGSPHVGVSALIL